MPWYPVLLCGMGAESLGTKHKKMAAPMRETFRVAVARVLDSWTVLKVTELRVSLDETSEINRISIYTDLKFSIENLYICVGANRSARFLTFTTDLSSS